MKYGFSEDILEIDGHVLRRIYALKDIGPVKKDTFGGWIESESNLSQEDLCWVYPGAKVFGNAIVKDNAKIFENALIYDNTIIMNNVFVYENAKVYGNSVISDYCWIEKNADISGDSLISGCCRVSNKVVSEKIHHILKNRLFINYSGKDSSGRDTVTIDNITETIQTWEFEKEHKNIISRNKLIKNIIPFLPEILLEIQKKPIQKQPEPNKKTISKIS